MNFLRRIEFNFLYRLIRYTGLVGILRLLIGLISQKVIAVYLGAQGLTVLANLRNFIEILTSFSSVGAYNGVIAETAADKGGKTYLSFINSTLTLLLGVSFIMFILLWWQFDWLTSQLFLEIQYHPIIRSLLFAIPLMGLTIVMEAILSGKKSYKPVANLQLAINTFTSVSMVLLIYYYGLQGAIIAIVCRPVIGFGLYLTYFKISRIGTSFLSNFSFDLSQIKSLLPYISMTVISVGFVQAIEVWLRYLITKEIDISAAGQWTAMNSISTNYFLFISYAFTLYVLPKFSENNPSFSLFLEARSILKILMPVVTIAMVLIYGFRIPITRLLYTEEFVGIAPLYKWQLAADWFRVVFLVFAYYLVSKKMLLKYFIVEFFSFAVFICFSFLWIDSYGIEGVVMANFVRYIGCLILIVILLFDKPVGYK